MYIRTMQQEVVIMKHRSPNGKALAVFCNCSLNRECYSINFLMQACKDRTARIRKFFMQTWNFLCILLRSHEVIKLQKLSIVTGMF